jgi:hypothetical protein
VKFITRRSMEIGPKTGVAELVKKSRAALSGSQRRKNAVRNPPTIKPATSTPK